MLYRLPALMVILKVGWISLLESDLAGAGEGKYGCNLVLKWEIGYEIGSEMVFR